MYLHQRAAALVPRFTRIVIPIMNDHGNHIPSLEAITYTCECIYICIYIYIMGLIESHEFETVHFFHMTNGFFLFILSLSASGGLHEKEDRIRSSVMARLNELPHL